MKVMKAAQLCLTLCDPMDYTVHGILQSRILEWVAFPFSRSLPKPGIEPWPPTLQVDSLPAEPSGKSKNTAVGSLSLSPGDVPDSEIQIALQADSLLAELPGKVKVKVILSCQTLCYPMDYSLPGSSVHGILQIRI